MDPEYVPPSYPLDVPPSDPLYELMDGLILTALLQQPLVAPNDEAYVFTDDDIAEIVASQAHTDRITTPLRAALHGPTDHAVLAPDSQPMVPLSPFGSAGSAFDRVVAAEPELQTPANRVSTVALPLAPTPRWLRVDRSTRASTTTHAIDTGRLSVAATQRPRSRRQLFADEHPPPAPSPPSLEYEKPDEASDRSTPPLYRSNAVAEAAHVEAIDRIRRLRMNKLNWANKQKRLHKHRLTVINWLMATHPELATEYESSAMNVDGVRVKDLL